MADGKGPKDPHAAARSKIPRLQRHLRSLKERQASKFVPERQLKAGRQAGYQDWLNREISRTETQIENLRLSLPGAAV